MPRLCISIYGKHTENRSLSKKKKQFDFILHGETNKHGSLICVSIILQQREYTKTFYNTSDILV